MFQFSGFADFRLYGVVPFGYPSVITVICTSTRLFAACHVLRRRRDPRHPPCALIFFLLFLI